jgi:F-type H+-transporting ATPase subunit delta
MASAKKQIQQLARQLFKVSFVADALSAERVTGVLEYIEKHRPPHAMAVLKAYHRLVAAEVARSQAVVEHAGFAAAPALDAISAALSKKYGRSIAWISKPNPSLIAGLRIHVGDDVYESSVAAQLDVLASAV